MIILWDLLHVTQTWWWIFKCQTKWYYRHQLLNSRDSTCSTSLVNLPREPINCSLSRETAVLPSSLKPNTSDPWMLEVVKGYRLELVQTPFQIAPVLVHMRNRKQCRQNPSSASKAGSSWFHRKMAQPLNHFMKNHHFKIKVIGKVKELLRRRN